MDSSCFHSFQRQIDVKEIPSKLNSPFETIIPSICKIAVADLQEYLENQKDFIHDFGLNTTISTQASGKMFGVLIVQNTEGKIGYLKAFSGKLASKVHLQGFVPPIFDFETSDPCYLEEQAEVNALNNTVLELESSTEKNDTTLLQKLRELKKARKEKSSALQKKFFLEYQFLNAHTETKGLYEIFSLNHNERPPSAAGECAAPKLLQYAYKHQLKPIAIAEFWWGMPPKSGEKVHKEFYPACREKCEPILGHMLQGLKVEASSTSEIALEKVYEDEYLLVINKPSHFPSIPKPQFRSSVFAHLRKEYPSANLPHQLGDETSGLMLIAKTLEIHTLLSLQFKKKQIKKRFVALLDGKIEEEHGYINLPIRPESKGSEKHQICFVYGKGTRTKWEVLERKSHYTKIAFYPTTRRQHQIRLHASQKQGLNAPIVGDELYGKKADQFCLQVDQLCFQHPITKEEIEIKIEGSF